MSLLTPRGSLQFNVESGDRYMVVASGSSVAWTVRGGHDDVPQAHGSIVHPKFRTGLTLTVAVEFWTGIGPAEGAPACGEDLDRMHQTLMLHLNELDDADSARWFWLPENYGDLRLIDNIRIASVEPITFPSEQAQMSFSVESPFPYAIDFTEQQTAIPDVGSVTVTNLGTTEVWPVFRVLGPTSLFVLSSNTLGQQLVYDASRPGAAAIAAGDYAEIDFFRNTIYLNGDQANLKAGIDVETSDFFTLVPGANDVSLSGATATMLWNHAWL